MAAPLVNGRAYDYVSIETKFGGVSLYSTSNVNYVETQEKVNNMGTGNRGVSRGRGGIENSGSFDLSMNDTEKLRAVAPGRSLLALPPFDVIVKYGDAGQIPVVDIIKNVEFTDDGVETTVGDTDIKRTFGIIFSHVQR